MKLPFASYFASVQAGQPIPEGFGARLVQAFEAVAKGVSNIELQTNSNSAGFPQAPPAVNAINVAAANGHHTVTITDQNTGLRRAANYWLERDTNPQFTNPHIIDLGQSRNHQEFLGNGTYYWRGYSSYSASAASKPVYHGSADLPAPVNAGGDIGPAIQLLSQGSGTGAPAQGLVGPGPVPIREQSTSVLWSGQSLPSRAGFLSPTGQPPVGFQGGSSGGGGSVVGAPLVDLYANWTTAKYAPANYPIGTTFVLSDRSNVTYIVIVSGGAQKWAWYSGAYSAAIGSLPTTGFNGAALGALDAGFLFFENVTYFHQLEWTGSVWHRGPNDRDHSDTFADFGAAPTDGGWHSCDGSTQTYLKYDGTTASRVLPNLATAAYGKQTLATYNATLNAPTVPTIGGNTDASGGIAIGGATDVDGGGGTSINNPAIGTPTTVAAHTHTHAPGTLTGAPHTHPLSAANAPIALPADPVENYSVVRYYRL